MVLGVIRIVAWLSHLFNTHELSLLAAAPAFQNVAKLRLQPHLDLFVANHACETRTCRQ